LSSYSQHPLPTYSSRLGNLTLEIASRLALGQSWHVLAAAVFLVTIPVFIQAPLVRVAPWVSVVLTGSWLGLGLAFLHRPLERLWGDLLFGFSWTWLAGSIYWGWLRWEPLLHLPIEAIGLPFALWGMTQRRFRVGSFFYLGSLFGTVLTDVYFYLVRLIPHWRQLMAVAPSEVQPIFRSALAQVYTPWGLIWAFGLIGLLFTVGMVALQVRRDHWWAFGGAVLSTILVDGLFLLAAIAA
jgi:hypothetical protein